MAIPKIDAKTAGYIPPEILYKYRDWRKSNHKRILTDNELFFTAPKNFNDPFDVNIPFRYDKLSIDDLKNNFEKYFDLTSLSDDEKVE